MKAITAIRLASRLSALGLAIVICAGAGSAVAQEVDHSSMHMPPPAAKPAAKDPVAKKPTAAKKPGTAAPAKAVDPHAGHVMPATRPAAKPAAKKPVVKKPAAKKPANAPPAKPVDPHSGHVMPAPASRPAPKKPAAKKPAPKPPTRTKPATAPTSKPTSVDPHAGHAMPAPATSAEDHAAMGHDMPAPSDRPRVPIPVLTEADRIAAFPVVAGHAAHDNTIHSYWLLDRFEGWNAGEGTGIGWEALGWIGTDLDRAWLRSEGERADGAVEAADVEMLYGRSVARWWDVVAGVRHDFGEGPSQTFAAIGMIGLAPQKFEVEATAYIGPSGQTAARLEAEYDTLLTNRLILQWQAEVQLYGRDDARRGIGSGLSTAAAGLRLRYEFTRRFAPYVGVEWERAYGGTADFRRNHVDDIDDTRLVAGIRIWF